MDSKMHNAAYWDIGTHNK